MNGTTDDSRNHPGGHHADRQLSDTAGVAEEFECREFVVPIGRVIASAVTYAEARYVDAIICAWGARACQGGWEPHGPIDYVTLARLGRRRIEEPPPMFRWEVGRLYVHSVRIQLKRQAPSGGVDGLRGCTMSDTRAVGSPRLVPMAGTEEGEARE